MEVLRQNIKTHQTGEFVKNEAALLKKYTPEIPVTTNFTARYYALDYTKLKESVDVISWDKYPEWCVEDNVSVAMTTAMNYTSAAAGIAASRKGAAPSIPVLDEVEHFLKR